MYNNNGGGKFQIDCHSHNQKNHHHTRWFDLRVFNILQELLLLYLTTRHERYCVDFINCLHAMKNFLVSVCQQRIFSEENSILSRTQRRHMQSCGVIVTSFQRHVFLNFKYLGFICNNIILSYCFCAMIMTGADRWKCGHRCCRRCCRWRVWDWRIRYWGGLSTREWTLFSETGQCDMI